ncbi:unnamed protein product [Coffea canephora]|uniref:DH200=94 genomic scaffold, scaffold_383 n=1 Tax=Coffea canephora TaxID=49390 RepID=A0A068VF73_COFCA|nr:unnamed protein product [Coffea canephora]
MRSFFQKLAKYGHEYGECVMHDIVHDFAQFLTKNECHTLDGIGRNSSSERPRHLTILGGTEEMLIVSQNLFCSLKCVRTLTLSNCWLPKVPAEIGSLIHLRHLDLSWNPFVALPEAICDLYYLETLDITYCEKLSCLPEKIEGLVHLRHLLNAITDELRQIPQGLRMLTSLCSLIRFIARSNSDDLAILKDLNQLEILNVEIEGDVDFGSAELGKKVNIGKMSLFFRFKAHFIETPSCIETMEPPPNLEELVLIGCPGAQLPSWLVTMSRANNLKKLYIEKPCNISSLRALWKLSSLEELELMVVEKLECLGKEFFGLEALPHRILKKISSLKILEIRRCSKLRDHYSDKTGDDWIKISHISRVDISNDSSGMVIHTYFLMYLSSLKSNNCSL